MPYSVAAVRGKNSNNVSYDAKVKALLGAALLGFWPLYDTSDQSGNGLTLTPGGSGGAFGVAGIGDGEKAWSGAGSAYLTCALPAGITTLSVFGWIYPTSYGAGNYNSTVFSFLNAYVLYVHTVTNRVNCTIYANPGYPTAVGPASVVPLNSWSLIIGSYNGVNNIAYKGTSGGTPMATTRLNPGYDLNGMIGGYAGTAEYITGRVAKVGLVNRALTPSEIAALNTVP